MAESQVRTRKLKSEPVEINIVSLPTILLRVAI